MKTVLIVNGPNLNLLGARENDIYGDITYDSLVSMIKNRADELGISVDVFQSNHEGQIVDRLNAAAKNIDALIINPAAYTHTSVAIRDAISALSVRVYEIHISNIHKREEFRHQSYVSGVADGVICGFGADGYIMALEHVAKTL